MVVNRPENTGVKFISYTGRFPNLCSGILTLEIDGKIVTFGDSFDKSKPNYRKFWHSGGWLNCSEDEAYCGEWKIDYSLLPECFRKYAAEIDKVFYVNVPCGCCGGCL